VTQPSLSRDKYRGLPAVRLLMIFSFRSGYTSVEAISNMLQTSFPQSFGNAEIAVVRPDGTNTSYAVTKADLIASLRHPAGNEQRGPWNFGELAGFAGRRAILYVVGANQNVPPGILSAAGNIGALVYEVGGNPYQGLPFTNEPSPTGPPLMGGGVNGDPAYPPFVGSTS
jgi:hypothetical protein